MCRILIAFRKYQTWGLPLRNALAKHKMNFWHRRYKKVGWPAIDARMWGLMSTLHPSLSHRFGNVLLGLNLQSIFWFNLKVGQSQHGKDCRICNLIWSTRCSPQQHLHTSIGTTNRKIQFWTRRYENLNCQLETVEYT
jgi:hypothetical protein